MSQSKIMSKVTSKATIRCNQKLGDVSFHEDGAPKGPRPQSSKSTNSFASSGCSAGKTCLDIRKGQDNRSHTLLRDVNERVELEPPLVGLRAVVLLFRGERLGPRVQLHLQNKTSMEGQTSDSQGPRVHGTQLSMRTRIKRQATIRAMMGQAEAILTHLAPAADEQRQRLQRLVHLRREKSYD
jgi:hypothetical protein